MSPSVVKPKSPPPYQRPNLYIHGIGAAYPQHSVKAEELSLLARRFHPSTPASVRHFVDVTYRHDAKSPQARKSALYQRTHRH